MSADKNRVVTPTTDPETLPREQLNRAVAEIRAALHNGDLITAQRVFRENYREYTTPETDLVCALGFATPIPEDTVLWGPGIYLFSNPYRDDYVARCGVRSGKCPHSAWVLYKTANGARKAAERHAEKHRAAGGPVPVVAQWETDSRPSPDQRHSGQED